MNSCQLDTTKWGPKSYCWRHKCVSEVIEFGQVTQTCQILITISDEKLNFKIRQLLLIFSKSVTPRYSEKAAESSHWRDLCTFLHTRRNKYELSIYTNMLFLFGKSVYIFSVAMLWKWKIISFSVTYIMTAGFQYRYSHHYYSLKY